MNKIFSLERHFTFGIAYTDNPPGEPDLINSHYVSDRAANSFYNSICAKSVCYFQHTLVYILRFGINDIRRSYLLCQFQFFIVQIDCDNFCPSQCCADNCTDANHAAADDHDIFIVADLSPGHGVEAYAHRFYQSAVTGRDVTCRNNLAPRQHGIFTHDPVALYAQSLVMLTGVDVSRTAGCAFAAIGIRIQGYVHAFLQLRRYVRTYLFDDRTHLMSRNNGKFHHGIASCKRIQIGTAETYIFYFH